MNRIPLPIEYHSQNFRKKEKMMRLVVLASCLAILSASNAFAKKLAPPQDCKPPEQFASIDLRIAGAVLVPVTLNGRAAWMVLDTANGWSLLNKQAAIDFGLKLTDMPRGVIVGSGENRVRNLAVIDSFSMGDYAYRQSKMMVTGQPTPLQTIDDRPVVGFMALDFFAAVDFELDLANRKLNVFSQNHCPGKGLYWSDSFQAVPMLRNLTGERYFPMELDGKKVEATFAISERDTYLRTDVTRKLYGFDEKSADMDVQRDAKGEPVAAFRAMKLTTSGMEVEDAKVTLRPDDGHCKMEVGMVRRSRAAGYSECLNVFPLEIGQNVLQCLRMYFATGENVLYYTAATAPALSVSSARK